MSRDALRAVCYNPCRPSDLSAEASANAETRNSGGCCLTSLNAAMNVALNAMPYSAAFQRWPDVYEISLSIRQPRRDPDEINFCIRANPDRTRTESTSPANSAWHRDADGHRARAISCRTESL